MGNENETAPNEQMRNDTSHLSEYEKERAKKIERNNALLRSLGLISAYEERISNDSAWKRQHRQPSSSKSSRKDKCQNVDHDDVLSNDHRVDSIHVKSGDKKRKRSSGVYNDTNALIGFRKSARLNPVLHQSSTATMLDPTSSNCLDYDGDHHHTDQQQREQQRTKECRETRQRIAIEYEKNGTINKNPTATYEHCLMRVRTMTHKQLLNRINVIERAVGKHCIIKMAITASCLKDEGLWDLATVAEEALERLKALEVPPS